MTKHLIIISLILTACSSGLDKSQTGRARNEIIAAENDFAVMAETRGLSAAFSFYADSAAVLNRGGSVIHGKDSIRLFYAAKRFNGVKLKWKPDFVGVSASADLGYTYGKFTFTTRDSTGHELQSKGIFHTVWKRQADGQWRFVWD